MSRVNRRRARYGAIVLVVATVLSGKALAFGGIAASCPFGEPEVELGFLGGEQIAAIDERRGIVKVDERNFFSVPPVVGQFEVARACRSLLRANESGREWTCGAMRDLSRNRSFSSSDFDFLIKYYSGQMRSRSQADYAARLKEVYSCR